MFCINAMYLKIKDKNYVEGRWQRSMFVLNLLKLPFIVAIQYIHSITQLENKYILLFCFF